MLGVRFEREAGDFVAWGAHQMFGEGRGLLGLVEIEFAANVLASAFASDLGFGGEFHIGSGAGTRYASAMAELAQFRPAEVIAMSCSSL